MSIKDKIIFGLLTILIIAGGYFQWMSDDMKARMSILNQQDRMHVDVVDKEFREDLRKLNLKFEGRGKHLRRAQKGIASNTDLINQVEDSLANAIDDVQWNLDELVRLTEKRFTSVEQDYNDLQDSFNDQRRRDRRRFSDLEQTLAALQNDVKKLNEKVFEKEKSSKK